jgi:hypothetical protein
MKAVVCIFKTQDNYIPYILPASSVETVLVSHDIVTLDIVSYAIGEKFNKLQYVILVF